MVFEETLSDIGPTQCHITDGALVIRFPELARGKLYVFKFAAMTHVTLAVVGDKSVFRAPRVRVGCYTSWVVSPYYGSFLSDLKVWVSAYI